MKRTVLATLLVACAAPGLANEAPVSEYALDPSVRSPLLTSPAAIAANGILDQFFAQMREMFTAQTSIAPFKAGTKAQAVRTAGALSAGSKDRVGSRARKVGIEAVSPASGREVPREAKKLHASVEIGSSLDTPWEAWENREEAVTDQYRDIEDR